MKLKTGMKAPAFKLENQDKKTVSLDQFKGEWLLIYFYPKDDTPGCTREACNIRDNLPKFKKGDLNVVGISVDEVKSHKKFTEKYKLNFDILSDRDKKVVQDYGVWGKKKFMGKEYMGTNRMSFLVDPKGKIAKIFEKVKPDIHADEVLEEFLSLK